MNPSVPRSPFSTALSENARETELRIRNIVSGPKKRPPLLLVALMCAVALLCGNLVSCQQQPKEPTLVMETQYYDSYSNYLEIPTLTLPAGEKNPAVETINAALNQLREEYAGLASWTGGNAWENHCLFYPSTTERYLNLLFFQSEFTTDLNTGHVFSLVYDKKNGKLVSAEDALALAGLNEKALLNQVTEWEQARLDRDYQEYDFQMALHNLTLEGFRIKADGQPVFYLAGRVDDVDGSVNGADHLYVWEDRSVSNFKGEYDNSIPLVPAGETDQLDPPLWNQWYFAGGEPAEGFLPGPVKLKANLGSLLSGQTTAVDASTGEELYIDQLLAQSVFPETPIRIARFAMLDLDRDMDQGNDMVLWLETDTDPCLAFLVLRWQNGTVYSYTLFPRSFNSLKADGTFEFSTSGACFGVSQIHFIPALQEDAPDELHTWPLASQEPADDSWGSFVWTLNGTPASETEFLAALEEQRAKTDAPWQDFTPENLAALLA